MIAGVIELKDTSVSEIMVPRIDVIAIDVNTALDAAIDLVIKHEHSRLPVFEENIDHIVGLIYTKDLVQVLRLDKPGVSLRDLLRPTYFVPESARVADLFQELQKRRMHMAVVVDEYGGTAGIVTLEDVIEEIVGEIRDEYDASEEAPIVRVSDSEALFNSRVTIDEVNETLGLNLTDEENDSIGGLIYHRLGKMPKAGDTIDLDTARLVVTDIAGRRIRHVRVVKQTPSEDAAPENNNEASTVGEKK
jgi:CBS domain containing-hemolysin-like protein